MKIGDFARLGQVSVRMLRHYDAIGLLRPAQVDAASGYRDYAPDQLARLHRIVALKDLGLTLGQIERILGDRLDPTELRGMLRLRRSQLAVEVERARSALASVEHRLHLIEQESAMPQTEYVTKTLPPRRLAGLRAVVPEDQNAAEVVEPLFERAAQAIDAAGACPQTGVSVWDGHDEGMSVLCGYDFTGGSVPGLEVIDLPEVAAAVCAVHLGAMEGIAATWAGLHAWLTANGQAPAGPCREVHVEAKGTDQSDWVTELQQPVHPA
ncbi:MerR family transcriptional regulator [Sphaerisporangium rufum]|nr:MerR family transcriptional regulator [Sphaerisporangium rufum]